MSDDVFYTQFSVPDMMQAIQLKKLLEFLNRSRSVAHHNFNGHQGKITIIVASRSHVLKYSECPLPGTHDFAAGWLAHEVMLSVSKYLGRPLYWFEAEFTKEGGLRKPNARKKPAVKIDWEDFKAS